MLRIVDTLNYAVTPCLYCHTWRRWCSAADHGFDLL